MNRVVYRGAGVTITVTDSDPEKDGAGTVRVERDYRYALYWPAAGDSETQLLIELCAKELVPLAILADRIDDVEPPAEDGPEAGFTEAMRQPDLRVTARVS